MSIALPCPAARPAWPAIKRGCAGKCPSCGKGKMFRAYLKVNDTCPVCDTPNWANQWVHARRSLKASSPEALTATVPPLKTKRQRNVAA